MDRNLFLAFALSFGVLLLWTMFVDPPQSPEPSPAAVEQAEGVEPGSSDTHGGEAPSVGGELAQDLAPDLPAAAEPPPTGPSRILEVGRSLFRVELDTRGAAIRRWELLEYDSGPNEGNQPVVLTTGDAPHDRVLVTPFKELGFGDLSQSVFEVEEDGPEQFRFRYTQDGVSVVKEYEFSHDSYDFSTTVRVENAGTRSVSPRFSVLWPAALRDGQDFRELSLAAVHEGDLVVEALTGFGKPGFFGGGEREVPFQSDVDWVGTNMTYFVAALLPDQPTQASGGFLATTPGVAGMGLVRFAPVELPPGQSAERVFRGYLGPKEPERLAAVGPALELAIDLGWVWVAPLTRFFSWLLGVLHGFIPNYGLAIIVLTVLVRAVTTPLTAKQMKSMERMRALSPKLQELKEKYGDDRQKQSEEMMRLYRQEGVNPLGGCLPMVLQLPVFIGLFYALRSSIQLRQAPFVGWIDDLSAPETLFIIPGFDLPFRLLPLIMGASMALQQRITPMQQMDPAQQRMMLVMMPVMMTFISYTFPSGLVLYWMVSNFLAIGHQLWVGRGLRAQKKEATDAKQVSGGDGDKEKKAKAGEPA